ncbi:MAG: hypothetical protein LBM74_10365 [Oscillospiraceae bacterium]|nr:hypothetical protein [Oscillospiraceae bacterium]
MLFGYLFAVIFKPKMK